MTKMKVILTKKAEYDFNEEKYTPIPYKTFDAMMGGIIPSVPENDVEEVMFFNSVADYMANAGICDINKEKSIYVSEKGNVFVFTNKKKETKEEKSDATANPEKDNKKEP